MASRTLIGLGSNLGDSISIVKQAIDKVCSLDKVSFLSGGALYKTRPWGFEEQNDFINAVILVDLGQDPVSFLECLQKIEQDYHRKRTKERYGPRTLDLDILDIAGIIMNDKKLTLPHPKAALRAFVIKPLFELDPQFVFADGKSVRDLIAKLPGYELDGVVKIKD